MSKRCLTAENARDMSRKMQLHPKLSQEDMETALHQIITHKAAAGEWEITIGFCPRCNCSDKCKCPCLTNKVEFIGNRFDPVLMYQSLNNLGYEIIRERLLGTCGYHHTNYNITW
jgi:hypothetical protein